MEKKAFVSSTSRGGHSSSLGEFVNKDDCRVLLLPLRLGAEGLDLVCANHIYLLEPLMNKSTELQVASQSQQIAAMKANIFIRCPFPHRLSLSSYVSHLPQAINRCDRIGQVRTTYIHKYVVMDTVEEVSCDSLSTANIIITLKLNVLVKHTYK